MQRTCTPSAPQHACTHGRRRRHAPPMLAPQMSWPASRPAAMRPSTRRLVILARYSYCPGRPRISSVLMPAPGQRAASSRSSNRRREVGKCALPTCAALARPPSMRRPVGRTPENNPGGCAGVFVAPMTIENRRTAAVLVAVQAAAAGRGSLLRERFSRHCRGSRRGCSPCPLPSLETAVAIVWHNAAPKPKPRRPGMINAMPPHPV